MLNSQNTSAPIIIMLRSNSEVKNQNHKMQREKIFVLDLLKVTLRKAQIINKKPD